MIHQLYKMKSGVAKPSKVLKDFLINCVVVCTHDSFKKWMNIRSYVLRATLKRYVNYHRREVSNFCEKL